MPYFDELFFFNRHSAETKFVPTMCPRVQTSSCYQSNTFSMADIYSCLEKLEQKLNIVPFMKEDSLLY